MDYSPSSTPIYDALSSSSSSKHADIIETIGLRLDHLRTGISQSTTMAKEAMTDLLKFTFNLLVHWPKVCSDVILSGISLRKTQILLPLAYG